MADDQEISQLISKSMRVRLSEQESATLEQHLERNPESRDFAELSQSIQGAAEHAAKLAESAGVDNSGASTTSATDDEMSLDARARMKASVTDAIKEKLSLSQAGLLDVQQTTELINRPSDSAAGSPTTEDSRELVSRFRIIRRLGEGGLGNVWLARDNRLNRNVAIKEMNATALESPIAWQRFHREAEITGHLEHPNVVPIYQFGEDRNSGEPFYSMRFVGKRTLADAIVEHHDRIEAGEDGTLSLHRLLSIFLDICQAIAYAHSRGVVHRDIKPENIALDNFGQVIVLDWGLAKITEDGELATKITTEATLRDSSLRNTMQGDIVGTPLYMAPEQAAGDLDKVDFKTDVYGLGAILFAILTGMAPHEKSATEKGRKLPEVLKLIAEGDTPSPSKTGVKIPIELEAICGKAMARKQHLRFDTVSALADSVESWMAGQGKKQASYENLRMEGRELRADLAGSIRNLERNVRFMATLPPIQELVTAESDEEIGVWRDRLATIFSGLLRANPDYQTVVYNRVDGDRFSELVRVERHSQDATSVRSVPKSRLRDNQINDYIKSLTDQNPEEVLTSLFCDPMCERNAACGEKVGMVAGVPVFDEQSEEVFGVVLINCDIEQLLRRQLDRRTNAAEIVVASDAVNIVMHSKSGTIVEATHLNRIADEAPQFQVAVESLQHRLEYIDDTDAEIYGARLWFNQGKQGIVYLLQQKGD